MNPRQNVLSNKFRRGWDILGQSVVDIRNLPKSRNGKSCNCICVECKQPLEACQGFIRSWYFRHQMLTDCRGGPITALHLLAQQLLLGDKTIKTRFKSVEYCSGSQEVTIDGSNFKADVLGKLSDCKHFVIEICVSHRVSQEKYDFLKENKIQSIEIDLNGVDPEITEAVLLDLLLNDVSKQNIIYLPEGEVDVIKNDNEPKSIKKAWYQELIPWAIPLAALGIFFWGSGRKKKSKNVNRKYRRR